MTPTEHPPADCDLIEKLTDIRNRMLDRGEYVTNEWADVADATTIGEAIERLRPTSHPPAISEDQLPKLRPVGAHMLRAFAEGHSNDDVRRMAAELLRLRQSSAPTSAKAEAGVVNLVQACVDSGFDPATESDKHPITEAVRALPVSVWKEILS